MAIKPLPSDQHAFVGTDGKPSTIFYTWLKQFADVALAFFNGSGPAWTAFTATIVPETGSITAYTANGRFVQFGKTVSFWLEILITNNGTGAGGKIVVTFPASLPTAFSSPSGITGFNTDNDTSILGELFNDHTMNVRTYDGNYPGYSGADLVFSGVYEAA